MASDIRKNFNFFEDFDILSSGPHDKSSTKVKNTEHWWYDITAEKNPCGWFRKNCSVNVVYCNSRRAFYFLRACQPNSENENYASLRRHGYLSLVSVVCCQEESFASGRSLVQRSLTVCVFVCVCVRAKECDQL